MLTDTQKATAILGLGHLVRLIHQMGNAPSAQDMERISAVVNKVDPAHQLENHGDLRASAIDAMEALVAELH